MAAAGAADGIGGRLTCVEERKRTSCAALPRQMPGLWWTARDRRGADWFEPSTAIGVGKRNKRGRGPLGLGSDRDSTHHGKTPVPSRSPICWTSVSHLSSQLKLATSQGKGELLAEIPRARNQTTQPPPSCRSGIIRASHRRPPLGTRHLAAPDGCSPLHQTPAEENFPSPQPGASELIRRKSYPNGNPKTARNSNMTNLENLSRFLLTVYSRSFLPHTCAAS